MGWGVAEGGPSPHPWGLDIPVAPGEPHPILGSLSQTSQGWWGTDLSPSRMELKSRPQPPGDPAADEEAERGPCSSQSHIRVTMVLPLLQLRAAGQCQGLVTMEVTRDGGPLAWGLHHRQNAKTQDGVGVTGSPHPLLGGSSDTGGCGFMSWAGEPCFLTGSWDLSLSPLHHTPTPRP